MSSILENDSPKAHYSRRAFLSVSGLTLMALLSGCEGNDNVNYSPSESGEDDVPVIQQTEATPSNVNAPFSSADRLSALTSVQRNSINMLNYLAVLMQEISASKNSRLLMEDIYSDLINNTSPNAVDNTTLYCIQNILNILSTYRMISVKRERLNYLYDKAQAEAVLQALPNPLGLLSASQSGSLAQLAASVIYMAVDSAVSYTSAMSSAELAHLQNGWELDDEEFETIHQSRSDMFTYTIETVSEYNLPGDLALTESSVEQFVEWSSASVSSRLQYLVSNSDTYCALGAYWLLLAQSYHAIQDWDNCIRSIEVYESLSTDILRKDRSYAKSLTVAIDAALQINDGMYAERASRWAKEILNNCSENDWATRYYAAQTYLSIFNETGEVDYLKSAYETALNNANELLSKQRNLNSTYLAPVVHQEGGTEGIVDAINIFKSDDEKQSKSEVDSFNKMLDEERKVALPPIYEPLITNLELLRAMADQDLLETGDYSSTESILYETGALFLTEGLDERYSFTGAIAPPPDTSLIGFDHDEISVPARYISQYATISVVVSHYGETTTFDDWTVDRVERANEDDLNTFTAFFKSASAAEFAFDEDMSIMLYINPAPFAGLSEISRTFKTLQRKSGPLDYLAFWDDGIEFEGL